MADDTNPVLPPADTKLADIEVKDASKTEEELAAHIDEELKELGVPVPDKKPAADDKPADEEQPDDKPEDKPADEEKPDDEKQPPAEDEDEDQPPAPADDKPEERAPAEPSDEGLFIEVEDANGVTHKISRIEDLPDDFEPKSNRQGLEILRDTQALEAERERRAEAAAEAEEKATTERVQQEQFQSWDREIAELAKTKRVDVKNTDFINDVFGYMNEINAARIKANNPNLVTSFEDALDKYEAKQAADKAEQDKKNDNERAKQKTALIGRSSAAAGGERYVYRAGSARSIDDIPIDV